MEDRTVVVVESAEGVPAAESGEGRRTLLIYLLAGVVYVVLGALIPELLFSWFEGVPFLIAFLWAARRLMGRPR